MSPLLQRYWCLTAGLKEAGLKIKDKFAEEMEMPVEEVQTCIEQDSGGIISFMIEELVDSYIEIMEDEFEQEEPDRDLLVSMAHGLELIYSNFPEEYKAEWKEQFVDEPAELAKTFKDPGKLWVYIEKYWDR